MQKENKLNQTFVKYKKNCTISPLSTFSLVPTFFPAPLLGSVTPASGSEPTRLYDLDIVGPFKNCEMKKRAIVENPIF